MELAPGTVIAGRYRLERPLAAGGMGAVWVARHLTLHTEVAIKFMAAETASSPAARGRFEREARSSAQIRHPNIVVVQDYGIEGDTPYLVMELLRGESLDDRLQRKGRLSIDVLAPIVQQMARGLRKAHEAGIVHRDLKPGNVFLARDDEDDEVVKILDFGIAKEIDVSLDEHTKTSELMGSPHYMSPEQLRSSKKTDVRSDLWSVGVMLYKALTGTIPFPGETLAEVMVQVFSARVTPASSVAKNLPLAIDDFFKRALARNPDERFQTIRELSDAFSAVATGKPLASSTTGPQVVSTPSPGLPAPPIAPAMGPVPVMAPSTSAMSTPLPMPAEAPGLPAQGYDSARVSRPFSTTGSALPVVPPPRASAPEGLSPAPVSALPVDPSTEPLPTPAPMRGSFDSLMTVPMGRVGTTDASARPALPSEVSPMPSPLGGAGERGGQKPEFKNFPIPVAVGAVLGVGVLLAIILVVVLRSGSSGETAGGSAGSSAGGLPATAPTSTMATAAGTALTPDEMAAAVPDESPVEIVPDEPTPAASAKQGPPAGWKPIPKGHGRLLVMTKGGGTCKVTINGAYAGTSPVDMIVDAGRQRIFCRMPTGSTRSKEIRVPEYKVTKVEFEVKL